MSEETKQAEKPVLTNEDQPSYLIEYDQGPLEKATRVRIEISLDALADNLELGTKLLRGMTEELKVELLQVIYAKRKLRASGKVILPAGVKVH